MAHLNQFGGHGQLHFKAVGRTSSQVDSLGPDNSPLGHSRVRPVTLAEGERLSIGSSQEETALILVRGSVRLEGGTLGSGTLGPRHSFINERAHAVYVAPGDSTDVEAFEPSDLMIATAPVAPAPDLLSRWIRPEDQTPKQVGRDNWSRQVTAILDGDFPARVLVLGETVNAPGNWSSSPPHKHDGEHDDESRLEESYYYRFDPPQGFGVQMIYTADLDIDAAVTVRDGDIVVIPRGFHPVAAGPGYHLYYLWVLAGDERNLNWFEDPDHSWINKN